MSNKDITYFDIAKDVSQFSDFRTKTGCIVVYKNTIISSGYNSNKTSPVQQKYNRYRGFDTNVYPNKLHAECAALSKIRHRKDIDWARAKIYVYRGSNGKPAMARPCIACLHFIKELGIKEIYYTGDGSYIYEKVI